MASLSLPRRRDWGNLHRPYQASLDYLCPVERSGGACFFARRGDSDRPHTGTTARRAVCWEPSTVVDGLGGTAGTRVPSHRFILRGMPSLRRQSLCGTNT